MEVVQGVHRLTRGVVNFYLVTDAGKLTLIDAGTPGDWDVFARAVTSLGRTLADLDSVLPTHAHQRPRVKTFAERARTEAHADRNGSNPGDEAVARSGRRPKKPAPASLGDLARPVVVPRVVRVDSALLRA